jgi:NTE family protein
MMEYNLALALGGGGVRCMAHVGVFKALEKEGIRPDLIVGSSIGSVIGGVYAYKNEADFLNTFALKFSNNPVVKRIESSLTTDPNRLLSKLTSFFFFGMGFVHAFWKQGFISERLVKRAYKDVVGKGVLNSRQFYLENSIIPFAALTTDIRSAKAVIITKGDIPRAMYASSAMPGVCKSVEYMGRSLMDGGIISILPVIAAHVLGAKKIIAVDTESEIRPPRYNNAIEALDIASTIRGYRWNILERTLADIVIAPTSIKRYDWYRFSKAPECIDAGYSATIGRINEIKDVISASPNREKQDLRRSLEKFYPYSII